MFVMRYCALIFVVAAILTIIPAESDANDFSGNDVYEYCKADDVRGPKMYFMGYMTGLSNGISLESQNKKMKFCLPQNITNQQKFDVVCKFMTDFPEKRHEEFTFLILYSFMTAFPCN